MGKDEPDEWKNTCQIVRSSGSWSLGLSSVEKSIQNAYIKLIREAKNFIYIENQFFISGTNDDKTIINQITTVLTDKILEKIRANEDFHVCVIIPMLPGFGGEIDDKSGNMLRIV